VRLQIANPAAHPSVPALLLLEPLDGWDLDGMHRVLGIHRHVVRLVEHGDVTYVVKELPDELALREYRLLRELADDGLPTVEVVAVATERAVEADGLLVTRHLDYSLPYRSLLSGRGLTIPYLGDRMLDALVSLLVRLHLAGFWWGDCSLSNTLFRRDAGALSAYVIDVETGERHEQLSTGQRRLDLEIATENVAGGLLDLQAGGRLADEIDPADLHHIAQRLERLHELGFDVGELEVVSADAGRRLRIVPRVVEHGFHTDRLRSLTGLDTGENQARRLLDDIRCFGAALQERTGRELPENVVAVRWLDQQFEPIMEAVPDHLAAKLEPAELYHQLLEHRWFLAEARGADVSIEEALASYVHEVLAPAPDEQVVEPTMELPAIPLD
jgi:tRNA A-37 threonylcarbamoyl transferase component Bud32